MLSVADFLVQLDGPTRLDLLNLLVSGLHDARMATQCTTDPGPQTENVPQLLAYLTRAIDSLSQARDLVRRHA